MMSRLVHCPASFRMCSTFTRKLKHNQEVDKSTTAHWLAAESIKLNLHPYFWLGKNPINDQIVDTEMVGHVEGYTQYIVSNINHAEFVQVVKVKFEVNELAATVDFIHYNREDKKLTIVDLRYGFSIVDVFENWELISYFWLWWVKNPHLAVTSVDFIIYQPRPYHPDGPIRKWSVLVLDLIRDYVPKINETLRMIYRPQAKALAGLHCHYCPVMLYCKTNLETCLKIINVAMTPSVNKPTNWILSKQLDMFQYAQNILKQRVETLKTIAEVRIGKGEIIPGYGMMQSKGARVWKISYKKSIVIGIPYEKPKHMSPRQAELSGFSKALVTANTVSKSRMKFSKVNVEQRAKQLFGESKEIGDGI